MNIKEDPIDDLLEQFCEYYPQYREWRWKLEAFYELTEAELNHLQFRAKNEAVEFVRIDHTILYHIAKKVLKS
jgi:hypothetical protein